MTLAKMPNRRQTPQCRRNHKPELALELVKLLSTTSAKSLEPMSVRR